MPCRKPKEATEAVSPEKAPVVEAPKKKGNVKAGSVLACGECGLVVTVTEVCGCGEACDLVCCGQPMKPKRAKK